MTVKQIRQLRAPAGTRFEVPEMQQFATLGDRSRAIAQEVVSIANQVGRSPAQVALAWLRQQTQPIIPIIGARKLSQFHDNLACLDLKLDSTQMERLDKVSKIELGFPHDLYTRVMVRTFVYAGMRERIDA